MIVSFAGTVTVVAAETSLNKIVYVALTEAVFATSIEFTNDVVAAGTVYRVVDPVLAAPRKRTLNVFAIIKLYHCGYGIFNSLHLFAAYSSLPFP